MGLMVSALQTQAEISGSRAVSFRWSLLQLIVLW